MLNGWKEIAAYIRREERTAMRWAAERGLPVHRSPGQGRGSVYALPGEIDAWLAADRERIAEAARTAFSPPTIAREATQPVVTIAPTRRRLHGWRISALIGTGACFVAVGALTLSRPAPTDAAALTAYKDATARSAYLQASYDWNLRTPASLQRAVHEYSDAIGREPQVAAAYIGLADTYLLLREDAAIPDADAYPRAEAAARAAAALAPRSAAAQRSLAFIAFWWHQDRAAARKLFARALALDPDDALTHHWFATALLANGEPQAALKQIEIARSLDPTATAILADRGLILLHAGDRAAGVAALRRLVDDDAQAAAPHRYLADAALTAGDLPAFLREVEAVARLRGDAAGLARLARWRANGTGDDAIKTAMLREAQRGTAGPDGGWYPVAQAAALLGRHDEAAAALARACLAREPAAIAARSDSWLAKSLSARDVASRCENASLLPTTRLI